MLPGRPLVGLAASLSVLAAAGCGDDGSESGATGSGAQESGPDRRGSGPQGGTGSGGTGGSAVPGAPRVPEESRAGPGAGGSSGAPSRPTTANPATTRVIRAWADALRSGNVKKAASYFAIPSIVQNGTPPVRLDEPTAAIAFNVSLPCGARLKATKRTGRYTVATFVLTKRPGGDCGTGTGGEAATAFVVRGGKIREWRRVPGPGEAPPGGGAPPPPAEKPVPGGPTV